MSKLRAGDVVVCIDGAGHPYAPHEGEVYEVLEVDNAGLVRVDDGVWLRTQAFWYPKRFEKLGDVR